MAIKGKLNKPTEYFRIIYKPDNTWRFADGSKEPLGIGEQDFRVETCRSNDYISAMIKQRNYNERKGIKEVSD